MNTNALAEMTKDRDKLRADLDEARGLIERIYQVRNTIHCNYDCGKCLRCRMPELATFLRLASPAKGR